MRVCGLSRTASVLVLTAAVLVVGSSSPRAQTSADFVPVTDAVLQNPDPADWLMWRRTLDGWGYSPLDQIDRENVDTIRMVWSRALGPGLQQGTPLVYDGVLYMPNPRDVIQAIDAISGDLLWEYRRDRPDDLGDYLIAALIDANRNLASGTTSSSIPAPTTSSLRSMRRLAGSPGKPRFSTTGPTRPIRRPDRSSRTAR